MEGRAEPERQLIEGPNPGQRCFRFAGREYPYLDLAPDAADEPERTVEIPLALDCLRHCPGPVLEVGDVLVDYGFRGHTVVAPGEWREGVLNLDIEAYRPRRRFGTIVSISMLEHLGWDDEPRDPDRPARVLSRLRGELLRPGGVLLVTVPLGYNPHLDRLIREERTRTGLRFLRRMSMDNEWREVSAIESAALYGAPFKNGNVVAVLFLPLDAPPVDATGVAGAGVLTRQPACEERLPCPDHPAGALVRNLGSPRSGACRSARLRGQAR
jgi:SAM-dependent methyltransferase